MITIKSPHDISEMEKAGVMSKVILDRALDGCIANKSLKEIDQQVDEDIKTKGLEAWFKEVDDYKFATCISVNEVWLHGIPTEYKLKTNDVVSIDLGIVYNGYYIDNCWTVVVGDNNPNIRRRFNHADPDVTKFLESGVLALNSSIKKVINGGRIGDISYEMQRITENNGYNVIRDYVGHGIGFKSHEEPAIPCYGTKGAGAKIKEGMSFAIELMYTMGSSAYETLDDGWTIVTKDRKISAMFEHTVVLKDNQVEILT